MWLMGIFWKSPLFSTRVKRCREPVEAVFLFFVLFFFFHGKGFYFIFYFLGAVALFPGCSLSVDVGQFKQLHLPASCSSKPPPSPRPPPPPAPPFSNGAVITPLYNLTHRLSQPQNRGYRLGGGSRGKSGTESLFSKSRCWTLRAPFCVWPFLYSPHCLPLLHVERHSAGRNGKFYFSTKNFQSLKKSTFERKLSTAQFFPPMSLEKMSHGLKWKWNYADYLHSSKKLNLREITLNFVTFSVCLKFSSPSLTLALPVFLFGIKVFRWH